MNEIQIFKNNAFGEVRAAEMNGEPIFCLSDVCRILELDASAVKRRLDDGVISSHPIVDSLGREQFASFVNEDGLYDVILDSRKPEAKRFRKWITSEVLPSIRKHGAYMTNEVIERTLTDPDYLIQIATQLKKERQMRIEIEEKNKKLEEDNTYKAQVIEGLADEIPLADMRQRITQIVQKAGAGDFGAAYRLHYQEFDKKYHINVGLRISNVKCKHKNYLDYIENELHMIPELYELTCKLFEGDYQKLMDSWGCTVRRARVGRRM